MLRRIAHAIAPVLKIDIHIDALAASIGHLCADVGDVLVDSLAQLAFAVEFAALGKQIDIAASAIAYPIN